MTRGEGVFHVVVAPILLATILCGHAVAADEVRTEKGVVEGAIADTPGVRVFRGIQFAEPPAGAATHGKLERSPQGDGVRSPLQAGAGLFGHDFPGSRTP